MILRSKRENMKVVIYGGGNIGRGFIAPLFYQSGYTVTFIDVSDRLIKAINERHEYPVRIISNNGYEDILVDGVNIINGNDKEAAANAIAEADIMATAVGVNVLKFIVPNLAAGILRRFMVSEKSLNIIICENLLNADKFLEKLIKEQLTEEERVLFDRRIGLVEASIGRMVPIQTEEMQDGDPLRVCVERYGWLPVDKDAFKDWIPNIKGLIPYSPFSYYIKRKLFIHNMGHAVCAYLGMHSGYNYIYEAIDDPEILIIVKNAMLESAQALSMEYNIPVRTLLSRIDDLLIRFKNKALGDICRRVGNDPVRKLSGDDRLVGSALLCMINGIVPYHIIIGIAAALHRYLMEKEQIQNIKNAEQALIELARLDRNDQLVSLILDKYCLFMYGTNPKLLRALIEANKAQEHNDVV
jgi:mannitol-1-phosphate 5-dehydrogenase